jgi:hypothetical protein
MEQERFYVVNPEGSPASRGTEMSLKEMRRALRDVAGQPAVVFLPKTAGMAQILREMSRLVPGLAAEQTTKRREERIEGMLRYLLDFDPLDPVEARIDAANAEMRRDFLATFPVVEAAAVHDRAGYEGTNKAQTAAAWRRANRILGLPYAGRIVYPLFQFDDDGQPWPLVQPVLRALPADRSAWQRAFWLVSPNEWLDERVPADALRIGDERVVEAAGHAGAVAIG